MKISGIVWVVAIILMPWWGYAQQQEASFDNWRVLTMQEKTGKVCYVTSVPVQKRGNVPKRSQPYVMVTAWGANTTEVSVASGYPYKVGSTITLTVDKTAPYQLYSNKKIAKVAWASTPAEHHKIIARMLAGNSMVVKGISQRGTTSHDRYTLKGFAKAYTAMQDLCKAAAVAPEKPSQKSPPKPASKTSRQQYNTQPKPKP
jgi:hypothetical protein